MCNVLGLSAKEGIPLCGLCYPLLGEPVINIYCVSMAMNVCKNRDASFLQTCVEAQHNSVTYVIKL